MSCFKVAYGDCIAVMDEMPPNSVQCVVTSPPYFGLRVYDGLEPEVWADGWEGCLGNEPDPRQYIAHMVEVFEGVRRVLKPDGVCWLNLGDSYTSGGRKRRAPDRKDSKGGRAARSRPPQPKGMKKKELMLMPHRVAIALQEAGWYVRMDVVWHKPNPMPESVRDRPTKAHEYVFMLTKSAKYYYDADAVKEPSITQDTRRPHGRGQSSVGGRPASGARGDKGTHDPTTKNRRSVWKIATKGYKGAHFAVMPEALAEVCVLAGSRPGDTVLDPFCGAGTTGVVALHHNRKFVGVEGSLRYVEMAKRRIEAIFDDE